MVALVSLKPVPSASNPGNSEQHDFEREVAARFGLVPNFFRSAPHKAERHRQIEDHRAVLQSLCRQEERKNEKLLREKEERERQYIALCRSIGKEPEPLSPQSPDDAPPLSVAEDVERALRFLLMARGFDPAALKKPIADFVDSVLAQQQ